MKAFKEEAGLRGTEFLFVSTGLVPSFWKLQKHFLAIKQIVSFFLFVHSVYKQLKGNYRIMNMIDNIYLSKCDNLKNLWLINIFSSTMSFFQP